MRRARRRRVAAPTPGRRCSASRARRASGHPPRGARRGASERAPSSPPAHRSRSRRPSRCRRSRRCSTARSEGTTAAPPGGRRRQALHGLRVPACCARGRSRRRCKSRPRRWSRDRSALLRAISPRCGSPDVVVGQGHRRQDQRLLLAGLELGDLRGRRAGAIAVGGGECDRDGLSPACPERCHCGRRQLDRQRGRDVRVGGGADSS